MLFLQLTLTFVLSEENLPFVACCVLVSYYLCSSYRSFTQNYQDLALKLFEQHDRLRPGLYTRRRLWPDDGRTVDNVKRIPKELFNMACEELMPIRESVCFMVLKATLSVIFVFFVFSLRILLKASPVTTALVTFVVGASFKIVIIYVDRRWQKRIDINEKAGKIVQEYINIRCPCNQREHLFSSANWLKKKDDAEALDTSGYLFSASLHYL